ncbi:MAG: tetratricopeptide repeat protein [Ferruginibacter sp.]
MKKILFSVILFSCCNVTFCQSLSPLDAEGTALYQAGKMTEAIAAFQKALVANPAGLYSLNALGNIYISQNKNQEAYDLALKGIKLSNGAVNFVVLQAKAAIKIGKPAEAVKVLDAFLQKNQPDFMLLFVKGNALAALNEQQQAIGLYSKSIDANPDFPPAYLERAKLFAGLERWPQALNDYNHYITLVSDDADAYNLRGIVFFKTNVTEKALDDFNSSLQLNPKQEFALANRGVLYRNSNQVDKALSDFNAAIAIDPAYADPYFEKAILYDNQKDYNAALPLINKAAELQPSWSIYRGEQSKILLALDKSVEGLAAAQEAIRLDPKNPDGYLFKTVAFYNLEKFDEALQAVNDGISSIPGNYLYYSLRASIYRKKGNNALADADDAQAKELSTH